VAEVMVALLVLALGAAPLFMVHTGAHEDTVDAVAFLGLLDRLDESRAAAAPGADGLRRASVKDGARELAQVDRADPYISFAPPVEVKK
jgi:hypothetical protein